MVERPSELSALFQRRQRSRRVVSSVLRDLHARQPIRSWNTILRSRPGRDVTVTGPFVPGQRRLSTPGSSGNDNVNTPADPSFDVTEDLWIAASFAYATWPVPAVQAVMSHREGSAGWTLRATVDPSLQFLWGDGSTNPSSTAPPPASVAAGERTAIGVWLDVDNGAGGHTIHWYESSDDGQTWTEFHSQTGAGTTTVAPAAALPSIGNVSTFQRFDGDIWWTEIRDGDQNGPLISRVDFTTAEVGASTVEDLQGHVWTVSGAAEVK